MSAPDFITALFCEGEFVRSKRWPTEPEARAYALGCEAAAAEYGAGACRAYVLPGDGEQMAETESDNEVANALEAVRRMEASDDEQE